MDNNLWTGMQPDRVLNPTINIPRSRSSESNPDEVVQFRAMSHGSHLQVPTPPLLHVKRKTAFPSDPPVPRKKILTEDSMAAHLSNMHISSSSAGNVEGDGDSGMSDSPIESLQNYSVNMSEWDFERKLRTAQKITISKEILELDKDGPNLLPEILLNRIARPCSALVLWKPAPTIGSLIADKNGDNLKGNEHDSNTTTKEELAAGVDEMET